jgi:hypothetical protein
LPTYTSSPPTNKCASIPGGAMAYDGNGNLTNDVTYAYTLARSRPSDWP